MMMILKVLVEKKKQQQKRKQKKHQGTRVAAISKSRTRNRELERKTGRRKGQEEAIAMSS
jgi:hypothetical protein